MWIRWLTSKSVRNATDICRHVEKLLNAQRDLIPAAGQGEVNTAVGAVRQAIRTGGSREAIKSALAELETVGNRWLRPYPHHGVRENLEVVLVAIAVALAVRTFFLQPFKIPTGSMQPTLFGITSQDFRNQPDVKFPGPLGRFADYWLRGISYVQLTAKSDGILTEFEQPKTILPFISRQRLRVGDETYTLWLPPEELIRHSGLRPGQMFRAGDDILKARIVTGDHLFVDRVSYNFRRPARGDIIVFETKGIPEAERMDSGIPGDQFYIKRLVGLGGETISVGDDRHLRINGQRLDAGTPHFENVYSFDPKGRPRDSHYSGHVNGRTGAIGLARRFPDGSASQVISPGHYMVMGDNTMNSLDSRTWGEFPQEAVIGKSFFVYWPILSRDNETPGRFGWGVR